jgi:hypothetical protein
MRSSRIAALIVAALYAISQSSVYVELLASGRGRAQAQPISIYGTVFQSDGKTPVPNMHLQLRNIDTGIIIGQTLSDSSGAYSFGTPAPGRYVVEAVDGNRVLASSQPIVPSNSQVATNVILPRNNAAAGFTGAAFAVLAAAAAAGVTAWAISRGPGLVVSPER